MFADECGQTLRAHKATTWAPRGVTPVVKVTAKGTVRVSVAGLCCYRPGERSRLIYRTLLYRGRKGDPKGFRTPDLIRLLDAAHQQLKAPIVLVWDGLSAHRTPAMRAATAARNWLRVYQPPAYAPELKPGGEGLVDDERQPRQPHRDRPGRRGEEPPQTHAIPHPSDRRLPHRNRSISTITSQTLTAKGV
ncbi:transposase [Actinoplanes sichuanensis]|uniref:Transposase n=1 Tax=Actinoplanes sichuanensis TaxID=512349 RepID=A0ABW4AM42_9ACTN|nr:transposase [Actinoplanes sichuanensis]